MKDETRLAVASLNDKTVNELRAMYEELFDDVCRSRHKKYLVRRIGWRLQAIDEGGLSPWAKQKAQELAATSDLRVTAPREEVVQRARRVQPAEDGYIDVTVHQHQSVAARRRRAGEIAVAAGSAAGLQRCGNLRLLA